MLAGCSITTSVMPHKLPNFHVCWLQALDEFSDHTGGVRSPGPPRDRAGFLEGYRQQTEWIEAIRTTTLPPYLRSLSMVSSHAFAVVADAWLVLHDPGRPPMCWREVQRTAVARTEPFASNRSGGWYRYNSRRATRGHTPA